AGIVLLTPGFITDITGLLLLFPPSRFHIKRFLRLKFDQWHRNGSIQYHNLP
ncbi:MAG: FxsA family protein, partial [Desulfobacterales bacterium]|nr:FxsA family protein [Desulfobacterales bacterium]